MLICSATVVDVGEIKIFRKYDKSEIRVEGIDNPLRHYVKTIVDWKSRRGNLLKYPCRPLSRYCWECYQWIDREYAFMLNDWPWGGSHLCIGCIEKILDRNLTRGDFNWKVPLTAAPFFIRSERLQKAMNS